jgi:hypothetical protein
MVGPLLKRLGIRRSVKLINALGVVDVESGLAGSVRGRQVYGWIRWLAPASVGLWVSGCALLLAPRQDSRGMPTSNLAVDWVRAEGRVVPTDYETVGSIGLPYRRAIFETLNGHQRSELWTDHVRMFRRTQDAWSSAQESSLAEVLNFVKNPAFFEKLDGAFVGGSANPSVGTIRENAIAAFGRDQAYRLIAHLGHFNPHEGMFVGTCDCASGDSWCGTGEGCGQLPGSCIAAAGCGTFWLSECTGSCEQGLE